MTATKTILQRRRISSPPRLRFFLGVGLLAAVIIGTTLAHETIIAHQEESARLVDDTARSRMLSLQLVILVHRFALTDDAALRAAAGLEIEAAIDGLRRMHADSRPGAITSVIAEDIERLADASKNLLAARQTSAVDVFERMESIRGWLDQLLADHEAAIRDHLDRAKEQRRRDHAVHDTMALFELMALAAVCVLVLWPALRRLYHQYGALETDNRRLEAEVRARTETIAANESRLQKVIETMPVLMVALDMRGEIVIWNHACEQATGYEAKEIIGNPNAGKMLFPDSDYRRESFTKLFRNDAGFSEVELVLATKNGGSRIVVWNNLGRLFPVLGWSHWNIGIDVTERRQMDAALREHEKRLQDVLEATSDWVWETDAAMRFTYLSVGHENAGGLPDMAVIGRRREDVADTTENTEAWARYRKDIETRRPFREFTARVPLPGGDHRYIRSSGKPIFAEDGTFCGYRGTARDVTAEIDAERRAAVSQRLLHDAIDAASEAFLVLDREDRLVICNRKYREFYSSVAELCVPGVAFQDLLRESFRRGQYAAREGANLDDFMIRRLQLRDRSGVPFEQQQADGRWLRITERATADFVVSVRADITDLKQHEQRIEESARLLRTIIDVSEDVIVMIEPDSTCVVINKAGATRFGLTPQQIVGRKLFDLLSPDVAKGRWAVANDALASGTTLHFEDERLGRWFDHSVHPIANAEGKPVRAVFISRDITDRRAMLINLRQSQARLVEAQRIAHLGNWSWDRNINRLTCSPEVHRMFGFASPSDPLTLESLVTAAHPSDRAAFRKAISSSLEQNEPLSIDLRIIRTGENYRVVHCEATPTSDWKKQPTGLVGIVQDITERVRTELTARSQEHRIRATIEAVPYAVITAGRDGRIESFNPAAARMFGWSADDAVGQPISVLVGAAYRARHEAAFAAYHDTGQRNLIDGGPREMVGRRRDGSEFPISLAVSEFATVDQQYFLAVIDDITQRVNAELSRQALEYQLGQAQKMEALGQMAAGMAHEFNNLLVPMIGMTELALDDLSADSPSRDNLSAVLSAGQRARDLIRKILTFSHRNERRDCVVSLNDAVRDAAAMAKVGMSPMIDMRMRIADEPLRLRCESSDVSQMVINLLNNGKDALDGVIGAKLELELDVIRATGSETVSAGAMAAGRYARLTVRDNGKGMDDTTVRRIFEPFFTTKEVGAGTGMGLSVVHGIVAGFGGAIRVGSGLCDGTTIEIFLPLAESEEPTPSNGTRAVPTTTNRP